VCVCVCVKGGRDRGREGGKKGGTDRGREDQSIPNFKSIHFLYMKFDALWPLGQF